MTKEMKEKMVKEAIRRKKEMTGVVKVFVPPFVEVRWNKNQKVAEIVLEGKKSGAVIRDQRIQKWMLEEKKMSKKELIRKINRPAVFFPGHITPFGRSSQLAGHTLGSLGFPRKGSKPERALSVFSVNKDEYAIVCEGTGTGLAFAYDVKDSVATRYLVLLTDEKNQAKVSVRQNGAVRQRMLCGSYREPIVADDKKPALKVIKGGKKKEEGKAASNG